jgi:hypothetical protein
MDGERRRASAEFLPEDLLPEGDLPFFADSPDTLTGPGVFSTRLPTSTEAGAERGDFLARCLLDFLKEKPGDFFSAERR